MPSYKIKEIKHWISPKGVVDSINSSFYTLHTDNIVSMFNNVLERKRKINQVDTDKNKKIVKVEITKIPD